MHDEKQFEWNADAQAAFDRLRKCLTTIADDNGILALPDNNIMFEIASDASKYAIGAVLSQNQRPVAYFSRHLSGAEKNYAVSELE